MATIKSYTDIKQSHKLAEILPLESADMYWFRDDTESPKIYPKDMMKNSVSVTSPCWSLAALLDIIPYPTLGKHANETWSCASWVEMVKPYFVESCDNPIDACYEMIIKLHELNLL